VPWRELSVMSERRDFVTLFGPEAGQRRALCRRFGISPTTGYKVASRYRAEGEAGLADRSRRPLSSPGRTPASMEALVTQPRRLPGGLRCLARRLQSSPAARGARPGHAGEPVPSEPARLRRAARALRLWPGRRRAPGRSRRLGQLPQPAGQARQGLPRPRGRLPAGRSGWCLRHPVPPVSDRPPRFARRAAGHGRMTPQPLTRRLPRPVPGLRPVSVKGIQAALRAARSLP
jgi:hypothetical protein